MSADRKTDRSDARANGAGDVVDRLIAPHGGTLVDRFIPAQRERDAMERAKKLEQLPLLRRELADLLLIAEGALSPLRGFQSSTEVKTVLDDGRLPNGLAWTVPITLQAKTAYSSFVGHRAKEGDSIALVDEEHNIRAILTVRERFKVDLEDYAQKMYGTIDPAHPGVKILLAEDPERIAGDVEVFRPDPATLEARRLSPTQTREEFIRRGWSEVIAFQTRNPLHRSHEYLLRIALEVSDGVLMHPLVGETKEGDVPPDVRMACYDVLLINYLPRDRVLLSVLDTAMRYAGPAEAIHHAIMRQNYGSSQLIVGRDHAGVGSYYGPFDAQKRFERYERGALEIRPFKVDVTFWCKRCGGTASTKTCAHPPEERLALSGSEVRRRLVAGEALPQEITRPEVAAVLRVHYATHRPGPGYEPWKHTLV